MRNTLCYQSYVYRASIMPPSARWCGSRRACRGLWCTL